MSAWPKVRLGEVLRRVERFEPRDELTEYPFAGTYSFARGIFVGERKLGSTFALPKIQRVRQGDFVYCKIMAWEGAFGLVPAEADNCVMSGAFVAYELHRDRIDERFLGYFFKVPDHWRSIGSQSSGTNVRRQSLHPTQFEAAEIPLPPLAEQRRVVARIEELAAQIHEARTLRHQATEESDALLASAQSVLSHPATSLSVSVEDLVGKEGLRNGKSVKSTGIESPTRCLTLSSMRHGRIDVRDAKPIPMSPAEAAPFLVRKGDVYVIRGNGSKDLCGRAGLVTDDAEGVIFPDLFIQVGLPKERVLPEFFVAAWNSSATRVVIEDRAKTTSGIWKINQGHILSTQVPVPTLPQQHRIVAELDALQAEVDALKRHQAETAAELDALLPALLDRAFKGELCGSATTVNISPRRP